MVLWVLKHQGLLCCLSQKQHTLVVYIGVMINVGQLSEHEHTLALIRAILRVHNCDVQDYVHHYQCQGGYGYLMLIKVDCNFFNISESKNHLFLAF